MKKHRMLIGGEWVEPASGEWFESINPYTAQPWALIPRGGKADVDRAVAAAKNAFVGNAWRSLSASDRGVLLRRLADLLAEQAAPLSELETIDNGKLLSEMRAQLNYAPKWFHYFAGLADKIEGRVMSSDKPGFFNFTREEPLGVIAALTPWNSPLLLAAWKLAPALAAGNTVVLKPSEHSSVSALAFGELFEKAGFPPGVVNIVTGFGNEVGEPLITHPDVAKVAFTGGDKTGQKVYEQAARSIKRVTLELGGKSANIVFDDADLDQAVKGVVSGIFAATGQTCIAGSRALVIGRSTMHSSIDWLRWHAAHVWEIRWSSQRRSGQSQRNRSTARFSSTWKWQRAKAPSAFLEADRRPDRSAAPDGLSNRPFSPASKATCVLPTKKYSVHCSLSFRSTMKRKPSRSPTPRSTDSPPGPGRKISAGRCECRKNWKPERCGSTAIA
jgi:hypothetical protein